MSPASSPPNILFLTWHDAGRWFGCYGLDTVDTPGIDRVAAEGCRFTNAFSACAICSPSRAAMMTGHTCQANGVMSLTNNVFSNRIDPGLRHLARLLKEDHGYRTALFGVQHEAAHEHIWRVQRFDEAHHTDPWPSAEVSCPALADWVRQRAGEDQPWYAQIGFFEGHLGQFFSRKPNPAYPQENYTGKGLYIPPYLDDDAEGQATVANLQGLLTRAGRAFEQVLDAIRASGQEENTLVVICVDHGVGLPRAKATCYDPGISVGWMLRLPERIPAGHTCDCLTTHIDVFPTVLELAGLSVPDGTQGHSLAAHAQRDNCDEVHDALFAHMVENTRSLRTKDWKLIRNFSPSTHHALFPAQAGSHWKADVQTELRTATLDNAPHLELYNLNDDPDEHHNLAGDPRHAAQLRQLDDQLWSFLYHENDFVLHNPIRTSWQAETRARLQQWCANTSRPMPSPKVGPA